MTQIQRTSLSVTHRIAGKGEYAHELITVKVGFSTPLLECPAGGTRYPDIPCQNGDAGMGLTGPYLRHRAEAEGGEAQSGALSRGERNALAAKISIRG